MCVFLSYEFHFSNTLFVLYLLSKYKYRNLLFVVKFSTRIIEKKVAIFQDLRCNVEKSLREK